MTLGETEVETMMEDAHPYACARDDSGVPVNEARVLVTGASGMSGRAIMRDLKQTNVEV